MRIREPKTTALIFSQGKIVVVGAKTEKSIYFASRLFIRILNKLGYAAKWRPAHFKFRNFVATTDLRFPVKLEALAFEREDFCSYEPEVFPGLIYRMDSPHVVLLVFVSGKIVFCGAKTREQIYRAFEKIFPILVEYQK
ncbi:hypothetical protein MHBO_002569 [Bonamia ostreae]|uniref:TATA-box-binding protein n=1 Tax=Bonamia ostreae TaxID=126728 RepID=A0ABV2ANE3_9EUKA